MAGKTELKKYLNELTKDELVKEVDKLYSKLKQVKEYYAMELTDDTSKILGDYKKKVTSAMIGRGNFPSLKIAEANRFIREFEKISVHPSDLVELLLHKVELGCDYIKEYGPEPWTVTDSSSSSFDKAVVLIKKHHLQEQFRKQCQVLRLVLANYFAAGEDLDE